MIAQPPCNWRERLQNLAQRSTRSLSEGLWLIVALTLLSFWVDGNYVLTNGKDSFIVLVLLKSLLRDGIGAIALVGLIGLLPGRVSSWARGICLFVASLLYWYEVTLFQQNNILHGYVALLSAGGTNDQEAVEYLSSIDISRLAIPLLVYALALAFSWSICRLQRKYSSLNLLLNYPRVGATMLLVSLMAVVGLQVKHYVRVGLEAQIVQAASTPIDRFLWNTYGYLRDVEEIARRMAKLSSTDVGEIEIKESERLLPREANLVVIVGESLGRYYMHSYGYPLENTPQIDSLVATGDMVRYTDVISPSWGTIASLTRILSLYDNHRSGDWTDYPTLMMMLRKVYDSVEWKSAQESYGTFVQPLVALVNTSTTTEYVVRFSEGDHSKRCYDEALLSLINDPAQEGNGQCHFFHLMGSHTRYDLRYPSEWAKFNKQDIPRDDLGDSEREVIAHYMNSVYYNDHVVSEIIKRYAHTPSLVVYFPDHGEVLYNDPSSPTYAHHSFISESVEIPLFVYVSPELQRIAPGLYDRVKASADYPIMMDTFAESLLGILGVKSKYTQPSANFWSEGYDQTRPRVFHDVTPGVSKLYEPTR